MWYLFPVKSDFFSVLDDLKERPTEDFCMTADEEDMVFTLPRKTSSPPSPPKRLVQEFNSY